MKNILFVLLVFSFQAFAQTPVDNLSATSDEVKVFPFAINGIEFHAKKNGVSSTSELFHPQGVELERITKIHSRLIGNLSPASSDELSRTLHLLGVRVTKVEYQITSTHDPRIFIEDIFKNGEKVHGQISLRILIPSQFNHLGTRISDSKFSELLISFVSDIQNKLKESDQYRVVMMLQESAQVLGHAGRAPAFERSDEVSDASRAPEQEEERTLFGVIRVRTSSQR